MFMKRFVNLALLLGFLLLDWLIFHDFIKTHVLDYTFTEYLTGVLSVPVMIHSIKSALWG